jgi:demethylmenaquinone methyltransferase / 2-methoxy-6-polyprenyl-1,4-benzoquinol methylase
VPLSDIRDSGYFGEKSRRVRDMFGSIAARYDFLNHFLSANLDRQWRQICVKEIQKRTKAASPRILDVGCGTADLSVAFSGLGSVIGCDFCHPMLCLGNKKITGIRSAHPINLLEADALMLPFPDKTFDVVVSAFVLRNLADINQGLTEMKRVLRPGGLLGILDFGMPQWPLLSQIYRFYFLRVLPKIGKLLSGVDGPYGYLPDSVQAFPPVEELKQKAGQAGLIRVEHRRLTAGIAVLLIGSCPD